MRKRWSRNKVLTVLMLLVALLGSGATLAGADSQVPVMEVELDNGMKMLLVSRPEMTTVSAGWVAHVGSSNE